MSTNRNQMIGWVAFSICAAGFLSACATNPSPLPPGSPADPQVRAPAKTPRNLLARDETTLAIEKQLSATEAYAESAEKMEHDMKNMPGMQHGGMQGMQHEGMKIEGGEQKEHTGEMKGHERVNHGRDEYLNARGYTTNQVEAYFGQLKRSIDGTHHHVSREHLARYLAQHDFLRTTYKLDDSTRLCLLVEQTGGRRLTYKPLTGEA